MTEGFQPDNGAGAPPQGSSEERSHDERSHAVSRRRVLRAGGSIAAGGAAAAFLAACGSSGGSGSTGGTGAGTANTGSAGGSAAGSGTGGAAAGSTGSASTGSGGGNKKYAGTKITVATVSNPQMTNMQKLVKDFKDRTGIDVKFLTLNEVDLRKKIKQDVALGSGSFDVVMISNYQTRIFAADDWIADLDSEVDKLSADDKKELDLDDVLPVWRNALSYKKKLYSLPFYGESSIMFYRKDLFDSAGIKMPDKPTWEQVEGFAKKLNSSDHSGIALRGKPGWGANMAPFDTVLNTFGGRWYNKKWEPQLDSKQVKNAAKFYSSIIQNYGQSGAVSDNFPECEQLFSSGKAAMWYDATSAAGYLTTPDTSKVADNVGFAHAPTAVTPNGSHWLYAWSLSIEKASKHKGAAFEFIKWATGKRMVQMMGKTYGWNNVPPGTRKSTYSDTKYGKKPWADLELQSINKADPAHPTKDPVPYKGIQFIDIPEFESMGDQVGRYLASLIADKTDVEQFVTKSQAEALQIAKQGQYLKS